MRLAPVLIVSLITALPLQASEDQIDILYDALKLDEVIEVMRLEGVEYGETLERDLFPGRGGPAWNTSVSAIYVPSNMENRVRDEFSTRMEGVDLDPLIDFFTSVRGVEIIALELEARRAMMDEAVEEMAEAKMAEMQAEDDPRMVQIEDLVVANDLVETNVVGAMNANYAFYTGLADGGAFGDMLDEGQILSDVWSQEPEIRADTSEWVYSYLALAYQPLSDDDLAIYTALSITDEGRALNAALFGAFDAMYVDISRELGTQAAAFMAGEDI